jgi:hypothetical protein
MERSFAACSRPELTCEGGAGAIQALAWRIRNAPRAIRGDEFKTDERNKGGTGALDGGGGADACLSITQKT